MKKYFSVFICILLFCSLLCGCGAPRQENPDKDELPSFEEESYVLLVYMCGSTLESKNGAASRNLAEIAAAECPEKAQIVVQTGGARAWRGLDIPADKSCRYEIKNGALICVWEDSPRNMGQAETLSDFVIWAVENYPVERYGLILWDHGGGSVKGVCCDEQFNGDWLSLSEMDIALSSAAADSKIKFDFIGFDACLMATIDTAAIVGRYADNMIASQELEPSGGWNYTAVIENLGKKDFYEQVLQGYAQKCAGKDYYTLSHIDFSAFDEVERMFGQFIGKLEEDAAPRTIISALNAAVGFGMTVGVADLYDLGNLFAYYGIEGNMGECIACVNGELRRGATGLSLYFPLDSFGSLDTYISVNPYTEYSEYLADFYADREKEVISFLSYAELKDNKLSFTITHDSLDYVQSMEYDLYMIEQSGNGSHLFLLGTDNDTQIVGATVEVNFEGRWVFLGGMPLYCSIVDRAGSLTVYSAPVSVNFYFADLIFSYDDKTKETQIWGVIYEGEEGRLYDLQDGDEIYVTRYEVTADYPEYDYPDPVIYNENTCIEVGCLPDGYYRYTAYITDVYGKRYAAGTVILEMKEGEVILLALTPDEIAVK